MSLSLRLTDSLQSIESNINSAIVQMVNDRLNKKQNYILSESKKLVEQWVGSQPEIASLSSYSVGSLVALFGITGSTSYIVSSIIKAVSNSISIKFVPFKPKMSGGLELYFQPSDFNNLLSLPQGHTKIANGDLHWLEWLLKRGDTIIISNYTYNPTSGLGRTRLGNMVQGSSFRVPPEFSGTENNNFITRALVGATQEQQLTQLFKTSLS